MIITMMMMMIIITIPGEAVQTIETNDSRRHIIRNENNSLRDLHNSSGDTKAEINNNCYFYYSFKFFPSLKTS